MTCRRGRRCRGVSMKGTKNWDSPLNFQFGGIVQRPRRPALRHQRAYGRRREPPRRRADRTSQEAAAARALRSTSPKTRGLSTEEGEDNERERWWCLMNVSEHLRGERRNERPGKEQVMTMK